MLVPVNQKDTAVKIAHIMGLSTSAAATDTAEDCQGSKVMCTLHLNNLQREQSFHFSWKRESRRPPGWLSLQISREACSDSGRVYHLSGSIQRLK